MYMDALDFFMFSFFMMVITGLIATMLVVGINGDNERTTFKTLCTSHGGQVYHNICLKDNRVILDGRNK